MSDYKIIFIEPFSVNILFVYSETVSLSRLLICGLIVNFNDIFATLRSMSGECRFLNLFLNLSVVVYKNKEYIKIRTWNREKNNPEVRPKNHYF